jgi:6-phosphogluconolactonase
MFLKGLAAAAVLPAQQTSAKTWVYVGCYTARGQGIYVYEMNPSTGALTQVRVVGSAATIPNPSFLALSPNGRHLYCGNEIGNFSGRQSGSVTAFATDYATGDLTLLNSQPTEGRNPAHLSVDATGRFVVAANYSGTTTATNHVALIPITADGRLEEPTDILTHTGQLGPLTARQEAPHAHMAMQDPAGRFVLVNDLGLDRTFVYRLDRFERRLVSTGAPAVALPGDGPRHLAFHPNGRFVFVINELANTIAVWTWEAKTGAMNRIQTISTLPDWYRGISTTAHVMVSADGRFVYGSNRGHDSIAVFSCDPQSGRLTFASRHWTYGETPRNFNIDPSGRFFYVGHQNTDNVVVFAIDRATGALEFTGQTLLTPGQPVCFVFHSQPLAGNSAAPNVTFAATQNPVLPASNGLAQVTLGWNAPGAGEVDLRIGAPDGFPMGRHASWGTATTGSWVTDGMTFYLQDVTGGKPLTAANTLGTVRVHHRT